MKIILTGVAGFIGAHTARHLLGMGHEVVGLDNLNDYYDTKLKHDRLEWLGGHENFRFARLDVAEGRSLVEHTAEERPQRFIHLPAQAGDVLETWADCSVLRRDYGYRANTSLDEGIGSFVRWFRDYYG
jgi:nucleoside-diphosphate-sugar epimerase